MPIVKSFRWNFLSSRRMNYRPEYEGPDSKPKHLRRQAHENKPIIGPKKDFTGVTFFNQSRSARKP